MSEEDRVSITEVLDVLNHTEEELIKKIPKNFMKFLEENKSPKYISQLDHNKNLEELNLTPKARDLLVLIYEKYLKEKN